MARMLGRAHKRPRCCPWDYDFLHAHTLSRRIQRHREQQHLVHDYAFWYRSTPAERDSELGWDQDWSWLRVPDCQHGCNGSPCNGDRCTFICH